MTGEKPTFGTVCDGIGCGHLAFNNAGFDCAWSFEIEPFPSAVLAERFPEVKNYGDMNNCAGMILRGKIDAPDVFIGGTPCQAFSVAGKRKGLEDARGNLSLEFCRIADAIDAVRHVARKPPCAILWENVPGVLSDKGNAFGCFLGELSGAGCALQPAGRKWTNAGCVFGPERTVAWRVLDSQFFGVAQRRRRVFVVASAGDRVRPEEILFEREGVRRDTAPSRKKGQGFAADVGSGVKVGHWDGGDCHPSLTQSHNTGGIGASNQELFSQRGAGLVPAVRMTAFEEYVADGTASTLKQRDFKDATDLIATCAVPDICNCLTNGSRSGGLNGQDAYTGRIIPVVAIQDVRGMDKAQNGRGYNEDGMATQGVATPVQVRRLTVEECEKLQALPQGWTKIPWRIYQEAIRKGVSYESILLARGKHLAGSAIDDCPDGPRYKGIGNGQTVSVMEWLSRRIFNGTKGVENV